MKNFIIGALIVGVFIVGGALIVSHGTPTPINVNPTPVNIGATVGPEHYEMEYFYGGLVAGGATTTYASSTSVNALTAKDICDNSEIYISTKAAGLGTTTLPTAANLTASKCLPKDGTSKIVTFYQASTTAGARFEFATSTGVSFYVASASSTVGLDSEISLKNKEYARCTFYRRLATAVSVFCDKFNIR